MKSNKKKWSFFLQAGFGLMEVMIAGALMAGLAVVGMKIASNQQKLTTKVFTDSDIVQFQSVFLAYLNKSSTCTNALVGLSKGSEMDNILFEGDTPFISVGEKIGNTGLEVTSIKILNSEETAEANLQNLPSLAHIRVGIQKTNQSYGGKDKYLYFSVVVDYGQLNILFAQTKSDVEVSCPNAQENLDEEVFEILGPDNIPMYLGLCTTPQPPTPVAGVTYSILSCGH